MPEAPLLEWDVAVRPLAGEDACGDEALVLTGPNGTLAAAVDGLGHGPEAQRAARAAVEALRAASATDALSLVRACHDALRATRGAAVSIAVFDARRSEMTWLGVGNVEAVLVRPGDPAGRVATALAPLAGVAGLDLPPLRPVTAPVRRGDTLVMATDGINPAFADGLSATGRPGEIARAILADHGRATDDALVLVARWLGGPR